MAVDLRENMACGKKKRSLLPQMGGKKLQWSTKNIGHLFSRCTDTKRVVVFKSKQPSEGKQV